MSDEVANALMDFRENNGGTLSGMTRYTDHLDDMPAIGYARSSLASDRIEKFLLLLYGHAANYQGRGSFLSNEQQSLYMDTQNTRWRASLGEIQASFCTPSQTLVSAMTAMQLVDSHRDHPTIWVARGAPRRWYAHTSKAGDDTKIKSGPNVNSHDVNIQGQPQFTIAGGEGALGGDDILFGVTAAPSRWGTVSYAVHAQNESSGNTTVTLGVDFTHPPGALIHPPTLRVRVRDPSGTKKLVVAVATSPDCEVVGVDTPGELVEVRPTASAVNKRQIDQCDIVASFK